MSKDREVQSTVFVHEVRSAEMHPCRAVVRFEVAKALAIDQWESCQVQQAIWWNSRIMLFGFYSFHSCVDWLPIQCSIARDIADPILFEFAGISVDGIFQGIVLG